MALKPSLRTVLAQLQAEGVVLPERSEARALSVLERHREATAGTPWFVRALAGFGAWLAALFILIFLAFTLLRKNEEVGAIILGLLCCVTATLVRHVARNVFLTQLTLAFGLAGQGLVLGGLGDLTNSTEATAAFAFLLFVVLLLAFPDPVQRFLSAWGAPLALLLLLRRVASGLVVDVALVGLAALTHQLFLHQGRLQRGKLGEAVTPAGFGLVTALFSVLLLRTFRLHERVFDDSIAGAPAGVVTLGLAAVTLYTVLRMLDETGLEKGGAAGVTAFVALGLLALITLHTPGIIAAAGILVLAFHRRNVVLLGLAVAFVLTFGVRYYYDLSLSLLAKSLALLGGGLLLLGLRLFILRRFPAASEVR
jgi:uncharacterized membrane protein